MPNNEIDPFAHLPVADRDTARLQARLYEARSERFSAAVAGATQPGELAAEIGTLEKELDRRHIADVAAMTGRRPMPEGWIPPDNKP